MLADQKERKSVRLGAAPPPVVRGGVAGDDGRQEAADVVAGGPEAPEGAALAVRVPGRQDARARRRPQALQWPAFSSFFSWEYLNWLLLPISLCMQAEGRVSAPALRMRGSFRVQPVDSEGSVNAGACPTARWQLLARLQQAVEAPEGQQQRVCGGCAEQDVDRRSRHQAACRMHAPQSTLRRECGLAPASSTERQSALVLEPDWKLKRCMYPCPDHTGHPNRRTGEQHDGRRARAQHARQELGEAVRDRQDGRQAPDLGQVHAQRGVLQHGRRRVRQAVARQVEAGVPARAAGVCSGLAVERCHSLDAIPCVR